MSKISQSFLLKNAGVLLAVCPMANVSATKPDYKKLQLPEKPNILWLVAEDLSPYLSAFGDNTVATPNLSRLAAEGVIYTNMYSVSGVSAPSRAAIITGMYPTAIGANHMRTDSYTEVTGLKAYDAVPAPEVKMFSELLRINGYYCSNNLKEDYQFKPPVTGWDESSAYAHWRNRAKGQPFFAVFNFTETHESGLFEPYGFRHIETRHYHAGDRSYKWGKDRMTEAETAVHLPKDTKFPIPPYLPNTETSRRDFWKEYNNIAEMDKQLGAVLKQLEEDGQLDNTIIFFYGDNGGTFPRQKRLVYDSGLRVPLIIRFPGKQIAGAKDEQLHSFVDFAPTLLSLTGQKPPKYMQGQAFLGKYAAKKQRNYIFGAADRFDEITDAIRAVRDDRFKYIRNYRPNQGYYMPISFREQIPMMKEMLQMHSAGTLNEAQMQWFRTTKPAEELFDCKTDPFELNNLASKPEYQKKLKELRRGMDSWIAKTGDVPNLPEANLIKKLWNNAENKPQTAKPVVVIKKGKFSINCATQGASIGYKIVAKDGKEPASWTVYQKPIQIQENATLMIKAHRIGYKPSETVQTKF